MASFELSRRSFLGALSAAFVYRGAQPQHSPYLQNVGSQQATIVWNSEVSGSVTIEYGLNGNWTNAQPAMLRELLPSETSLSKPLYRYSASLAELQPGQQYQYRVRMDGQEVASGNGLTFSTPRPSGKSFRFLVFGDSGNGCPEQVQLSQMMANEPADLVIHTGDIAYPVGSYEHYLSRYFDTYRSLMQEKPFFPCPGNHDMYFEDGAAYRAMHSVPTQGVPAEDAGYYYSFEWGNAHFYSLDSNCLDSDQDGVLSPRGARMQVWLEQQLQQARQFWRIVFFHHSPYASGEHEKEGTLAAVRTHFLPLLDRYAVPVVLAGHEHSYQRTFPLRGGKVTAAGAGTTYLTSGGGGGSLYSCKPGPLVAIHRIDNHYLAAEMQGNRLQISARGLNGNILDSVSIQPQPAFRENGVVDAASFQSTVAAGGQISIFGFHLAETVATPEKRVSTEGLAGTTVTLNGRSLPLLYVSPTQINAVLPPEFTGAGTLQVITANGSAAMQVQVQGLAPALFQNAARHTDGVLISDRRPAQAGEEILLLATGLGASVEGPSPAVRMRVTVQAGGQTVEARAEAMNEGSGLYRIWFVVPRGLAGAQPVKITADSLTSNTITLPFVAAAAAAA